jgi:hypothetical protein
MMKASRRGWKHCWRRTGRRLPGSLAVTGRMWQNPVVATPILGVATTGFIQIAAKGLVDQSGG